MDVLKSKYVALLAIDTEVFSIRYTMKLVRQFLLRQYGQHIDFTHWLLGDGTHRIVIGSEYPALIDAAIAQLKGKVIAKRHSSVVKELSKMDIQGRTGYSGYYNNR